MQLELPMSSHSLYSRVPGLYWAMLDPLPLAHPKLPFRFQLLVNARSGRVGGNGACVGSLSAVWEIWTELPAPSRSHSLLVDVGGVGRINPTMGDLRFPAFWKVNKKLASTQLPQNWNRKNTAMFCLPSISSLTRSGETQAGPHWNISYVKEGIS